ncbi:MULTISPECIES: ABC transporter substrate-binding protein [unclassified Leucobacter]|uniref:ABC transporter substrate-binding protein n=1 Tax=unclassified Leucobacter TaxID=2621730 RepID=UPI00165E9DB5|nr:MULTISPECIES: ABC transporter substrate-binding protein [unclassified Leucobacter]MBC9927895.1 ABC transporter substrate-binding protein [Leucobacter sp. cx-169]MBC9937595.1 ABC transporter substrate-binding protein [Leucobacter sp. cx-87]
MSTKHRKIALAVSGLAVAGLLAGCSGAQQAVEVDLGSGPAVAGTVKEGALKGLTLTLASWGGLYQEGQVEAASVPFAKASGATMLDDGPTEYAKIKAQVDNNAVTWDIVDTDIIWADKNCGEEGLLMDLDTTIVDTSNIPEGLVGDCYVPAMQYANVFMYNDDKFSDTPTSWADFFDTEKFPGKRAIAGFEDIGPGVYEAALLADGVPADELYPLDMDRAYQKLDTIKDSLIYWKTGAESQQMLETGEADMAIVWSGRAFGAAENGANYKPVWNQALVIADALAVPKNAKNPEAAFAYINFYLGADPQARLTEITSYSPVHMDAKPELSELGNEYLITNPEIAEQLVPTDASWWAKNYDAELERWLEWMQG